MTHKLDVNAVLDKIGYFRLYQWVNLLLNGLVCMSLSSHVFISVFSHHTPNFRWVDYTSL